MWPNGAQIVGLRSELEIIANLGASKEMGDSPFMLRDALRDSSTVQRTTRYGPAHRDPDGRAVKKLTSDRSEKKQCLYGSRSNAVLT